MNNPSVTRTDWPDPKMLYAGQHRILERAIIPSGYKVERGTILGRLEGLTTAGKFLPRYRPLVRSTDQGAAAAITNLVAGTTRRNDLSHMNIVPGSVALEFGSAVVQEVDPVSGIVTLTSAYAAGSGRAAIDYKTGQLLLRSGSAAMNDGSIDYRYHATPQSIPVAIATGDVDATSTGADRDVEHTVLRMGEVLRFDLEWPASVTNAEKQQIEIGLSLVGIVVVDR